MTKVLQIYRLQISDRNHSHARQSVIDLSMDMAHETNTNDPNLKFVHSHSCALRDRPRSHLVLGESEDGGLFHISRLQVLPIDRSALNKSDVLPQLCDR